MLEIDQILVLKDNYVYLVREPGSGAVAAVDPSVHEPVLARLAARGWRLTHVLNTHHHADHTGGNLGLKSVTGCTIVGYKHDADRIPGIDVRVDDGDSYKFGNETAKVIAIPGHTRGHIAFWFGTSRAVFCGDTLFALGCGRLFEGTPEQMWISLGKLRALPDETMVYCGHEYTQNNARFALTVEPGNGALIARSAQVDAARAMGESTVPSSMGAERATNPFLRADVASVATGVGMPGGDPIAVFAEVRRRKDTF